MIMSGTDVMSSEDGIEAGADSTGIWPGDSTGIWTPDHSVGRQAPYN